MLSRLLYVAAAVTCLGTLSARAAQEPTQSTDDGDNNCLLQVSKNNDTLKLGGIQPDNQEDPSLVATADADATDDDLSIKDNADNTDDLQANATLSYKQQIVREIEFELNPPQIPMKNKVILLLLNAFSLPACCGVDRCYMGQTALGFLKGLTCGGLSVWFFIDFFLVALNAVQKQPTIDTFGLHAQFGKGEIE